MADPVMIVSSLGGLSLVTCGGWLWRLASRITKLEADVELALKQIADSVKEQDEWTKKEQERWQELNRTLGRIDEALWGPMRERTPTRP